jgi:hypothetical protein
MNYLQEIENEFSRLRGRWTMLAPVDWQLAANWEKNGIPLRIVFSAMGDVDKKFKDKNPKDSINSLRYFEKAVEKQFGEWQKTQVGKADYIQDDEQSTQVVAYAVSDETDVLEYFVESLDRKNLPEPLAAAAFKARDAIIEILCQIQEDVLRSTDEIERHLEAVCAELELSLVVSIPEDERARMLETIKREYAAININAESRQKLLIKQAYQFFGLPKLTLFEL